MGYKKSILLVGAFVASMDNVAGKSLRAKRQLLPADKERATKLEEDVAFWTNLVRKTQQMSLPSGTEEVRDKILEVCDEWSVVRSGGAGTTTDIWDISAIPSGAGTYYNIPCLCGSSPRFNAVQLLTYLLAVFDLKYETYNNPDRILVDYPPGDRVLDTGWRGSQDYADAGFPCKSTSVSLHASHMPILICCLSLALALAKDPIISNETSVLLGGYPGYGEEYEMFERRSSDSFQVKVLGNTLQAGTEWEYQVRCRVLQTESV